MSITSGKVIMCIGLAALAMEACGGEANSPYDLSTSTGGGTGGAGGQGGDVGFQEVEVFYCDPEDGIIADAEINGTTSGQDGKSQFDDEYIPNELTIKVGQIVKFQPYTISQNMTSGSPPEKDGKFKTYQGRRQCLKFNAVGTYPFWSIDVWPDDPMLGVIYVE